MDKSAKRSESIDGTPFLVTGPHLHFVRFGSVVVPKGLIRNLDPCMCKHLTP